MGSRRQFLIGVTTAGTIAIAGCSGGGSGGGPEDTVEQYATAAKNNDTETANELLHPESPLYPIEEDAASEFTLNNIEQATIRETVEILAAQRTGESTEEEIQSEINSTEQAVEQKVDDIGADEYSFVVVTVTENGEQRKFELLTVQDDGDWLIIE